MNNVKPLGAFVLAKEIAAEAESTTAGGIVLPQTPSVGQHLCRKFTVVSVGAKFDLPVEAGDIVVMRHNARTHQVTHGHHLVAQDDVVGMVLP